MSKILHQYFMDKTASRYVFKNGKIAEFHGGVYRTSVASEIEELDAEILSGIGSIWVIPGQETINSDDIDPVAVMKRKIIAEYEAEKARANANGSSTYDNSRAKPVSTNGLGHIVASAVASK